MPQLTSRFTPSLLDEDTLNALFVHRHDLVQDAIGRIERAASTQERAHRLFVGPRGAGKTHLVSLIFHGARRLQDSDARLQVAWLAEDPWGIASYEDLLVEILERVGLPDSDTPERDILAAVDTGGPIVVLAENLDQILFGLGRDGQRRLRALLENHRPFLFIATTTKLTSYLMDQVEPFYGFFDTTQLEPFSVDEATDMLKAIARLQEDTPLQNRLDEPSARSRLAAVRHLAGGQPRVWALLGTGLTVGALDELVDVLMQKFDDLTPYYQEQLGRLSANERKVIRRLADSGRAMTVRGLAELTRIDQKSLARTVTDLRRKGWLQPRTGLLTERIDKRLTYYELAEPLVRLVFQLKASRGEPVKLILEFLTAWFDLPEIATALPNTDLARSYAAAATEFIQTPQARIGRRLADRVQALPSYQFHTVLGPASGKIERDPGFVATLELLDDAVRAYHDGDATALLDLPTALSQLIEQRLETVSSTRIRTEIALLAMEVLEPRRWAGRVDEIVDRAPDAERPTTLALSSISRADQPDRFELLIGMAEQSLGRHGSQDASAELVGLADRLLRMGHADAAGRLADAARPKAGFDIEWQLITIQAAADLRNGVAPRRVDRWVEFVGRAAKASAARPLLVGRNELAAAYRDAGRIDEALTLAEATLAQTVSLFGGEDPQTLTCQNTLATILHAIERDEEAVALFESNVRDSSRTLGPDHHNTLATRNNLATAYRETGRLDDAVAQYTSVLLAAERTLGADDLNTSVVRTNLALAHAEAGRLKQAQGLLQTSLAVLERVLGPGHPDSQECGWALAIVQDRLAGEELGNDPVSDAPPV